MATYTTTGSINNHYTLKLIATETDVNQANNTSKVNWTTQLVSSGGYSFSTIGATVTVKINGVTVYNNYAQRSISANGTLTIASGTTSAITHNSDGSKSVACSVEWDQSSTASYTPGDCTASGTLALTTIPRYPTSSISSIAKDINSVTIYSSYSVATPTQVQVYNGDTLVGTYISSLTAINIQGLSPNTTYNFKVRGYANGGWGEFSNIVAVTTYDYARFTNLLNAVIGDTLTVGISNPSGASVTLFVTNADESIYFVNGMALSAGTTYISSNDYNLANMYASVPNSLTGTARYILKTSQNGYDYWVAENKTITVNSNTNKPTFSDFTFADVDDYMPLLTGDSSRFIQGYSTARVSITTAQKAVAKNSATILQYRIVIGDTQKQTDYSSSATVYKDFENVNSSVMTVSAIDSRGLQTTVTKTAGWIPYFSMYYNKISVYREDGVGTKVFFDLSAFFKVVAIGSHNNSCSALDYRYRVKGSSTWSNFITLYDTMQPSLNSTYGKLTKNATTGEVTDNGTNNFLTTDFNNTEQSFAVGTEYEIQFNLVDLVSNTFSSVITLSSGIPCTAKRKNEDGTYSVGINCFPDTNVALDVEGAIVSSGAYKDGTIAMYRDVACRNFPGNQYGYLVIKLGKSRLDSHPCMLTIKGHIFNYGSSTDFTADVYYYQNQSYFFSPIIHFSCNPIGYQARFATLDGYACLIISNNTEQSGFSYPKIYITDVLVGQGSVTPDIWLDDWNIKFNSNLDAFSNVATCTNV